MFSDVNHINEIDLNIQSTINTNLNSWHDTDWGIGRGKHFIFFVLYLKLHANIDPVSFDI